MVKGILMGILEDVASLGDVVGTFEAEVCTWEPYQMLAVCASVEDVSATGTVANSSEDVPTLSVTGESWDPPSQRLTVPDTFWMYTSFDDTTAIRNERLPSIASIFVGYYPPVMTIINRDRTGGVTCTTLTTGKPSKAP
jgi:hypothetical protein